MLEEWFSELRTWSKDADFVENEAERKTVHGFRFSAKIRATLNAKTNGQRDSYCTIQPGSRAERLGKRAGLSLSKNTERTLRSKKDIQRFWSRVVASGIDIASVE